MQEGSSPDAPFKLHLLLEKLPHKHMGETLHGAPPCLLLGLPWCRPGAALVLLAPSLLHWLALAGNIAAGADNAVGQNDGAGKGAVRKHAAKKVRKATEASAVYA